MTNLVGLAPCSYIVVVLAGVFCIEVGKSLGTFLMIPNLSQDPSVCITHEHLA